jgi:hypothetical protein
MLIFVEQHDLVIWWLVSDGGVGAHTAFMINTKSCSSSAAFSNNIRALSIKIWRTELFAYPQRRIADFSITFDWNGGTQWRTNLSEVAVGWTRLASLTKSSSAFPTPDCLYKHKPRRTLAVVHFSFIPIVRLKTITALITPYI